MSTTKTPEEAARLVKVAALADLLIEEAVTAGDDESRQTAALAAATRARTFVEADWAEAARLAGVNMPSARSIEQTIDTLDIVAGLDPAPADPFSAFR